MDDSPCYFYFYFQFFDVAEVAIIHKTIFATFGYKLDMKLGKKKKTESFYIRGYLLELITENMAIRNFFFLQNLASLGHFFFPWKVLCKGRNHILEVEIWRNFAEKKL
jgi:hypothetical protein